MFEIHGRLRLFLLNVDICLFQTMPHNSVSIGIPIFFMVQNQSEKLLININIRVYFL